MSEFLGETIYDILTGEVTQIELTDKQLIEREKAIAELETLNAAMQAEEEAKLAEKAALLAKLGITDEEAKLLLG